MTAGSLTGALGLVLIGYANNPVAYYAVWVILGAAMSMNLYDSAFATLGRIFGAAARRPITALTLAGGFASTVGWPSTHFLIEAVGWRASELMQPNPAAQGNSEAPSPLPETPAPTTEG